MYGKKYQWILVGDYSPQWFTVLDNSTVCNKNELLEAVDGLVLMESLLLSHNDDRTLSGLVSFTYVSTVYFFFIPNVSINHSKITKYQKLKLRDRKKSFCPISHIFCPSRISKVPDYDSAFSTTTLLTQCNVMVGILLKCGKHFTVREYLGP